MKITLHTVLPALTLLGGLTANADPKYWTGATDTNWNTAGNWSPSAPTGSDDVIVTNTVNKPSVPAGSYIYNSLSISNGATVTCLGDTNSTFGSGVIFTVGSATIGGTLTADGRGFAAARGPGAGVTSPYNFRGNGGAHGGYGGRSADGGAIASPYGSATGPLALGSGGGNGGNGGGGAGGGAIKIVATGTVTIAGSVTASGSKGAPAGGNNGGGGGSGGSVWIVADTLAGSGTVRANGGDAGGNPIDGGGGAGGRIRQTWTTSTFSGTVSAARGNGNTVGRARAAGAGTYSFPDNNSLTVKGGMALAAGTYNIPALVVTNATLECQGDTNSVCGMGVVINASAIMVYPGATISADGLGFQTATGPGAGSNGTWRASGGGYGGRGGGTTPEGLGGGPTYTNLSEANPLALGSGGGSAGGETGGYGGGAIKLNATGAIRIDGTVRADGEKAVGTGTFGNNGGGGGSGGSIWIIGKLSGTGIVQAVGGPVVNTAAGPGGGGGGRISFWVPEQVTCATNVAGGMTFGGGNQNGGSGTVFLRVLAPQGSQLTLW